MADPAYLVFFVRDPVDDALAEAVTGRVQAVPGAGWFDDPGAATQDERTTGGYVRCTGPEEPVAEALLDAARAVSADLTVEVEVQWREEPVARIVGGVTARPAPPRPPG